MSGNPVTAGRSVPDGSIVIDIVDSIAIDVNETEASVEVLIKASLVLRRSQAMVSNPLNIALRFLPKRGIQGLLSLGVAANMLQSESLSVVLVKDSLVLVRRHVVVRNPVTASGLVPDGCESRLASNGVSVDDTETETLAVPLVELLLVLGTGQTVLGDPVRTLLLFPDACESRIIVDGVTADVVEAEALIGKSIELGLVKG